MLRSFFDLLLGCSHQRTTFPLTPRRSGTYVVCLDCGKEFAYNWKEMRLGPAVAATAAASPAYGVIDPNTTGLRAPVAEGRFDGLRRQVSYASTAKATASLPSTSTP